MRQWLLRAIGCAAVLCLAAGLRAQSARVSNGTGQVFVPWKVLNPGDEPVRSPLVLYWLPGSREEIRHSDLLVSRSLAVYAMQCVGMQVIRPDDDEMIERFGATGKLPVCVLAHGDGTAIARVPNDNGALRSAAVEKMVHDEIGAREVETERMLDDAREKVAHGDRDAAIGLYRRVAAEQCLFPRMGKEALKALRKLGVDSDAK
ncbi:MAG: hypothetical protein ACXVIJ_06275 [Thermoanaerobaculia bacterium]